MEKAKDMRLCFASVISEIKQSPIFLTVKARLFETPRANLNGARVTPAFLDEIIENQDKYVGLPLCADVKALANGNYNRLGHLYDARTGEFHSTQIGSFYKYEKENFDGGSYLVGYARVMKRNKAICKAIAELFADDSLKFSFEITCGSYEELDDGTIQIDAAEENFLEGAAIVSFPACEDAVALELVAECNKLTDTNGKGEKDMTDVKETAETVVEEEQTSEKEQVVETEEVVAETAEEAKVESEQPENTEEDVSAECCKEKKENATVYVTEKHEETVSTCAYDDQTGVDVYQRTTVETTVSTREEGTLMASDNETSEQETVVAEDEETEEETTEEEIDPDPDDEPKKKTAEEMIAEVLSELAALKSEIAELKEVRKEVASTKKDNETMNPFLAEISTPIEQRYSLLETAKETNSYGLLEKA